MWGSYSSRSSIVVSYLSRSSYVAKRSTAWDARSPYGLGPRELFFRKDRDSFGVQVPREGGRILPSLDPRDLRGGKRDDVVRRIVPEIDVEIMEIAARGAEDDDLSRLRHGSGSRRGCKAFLDFPPSRGMLTLNKVNFRCLRGYRANGLSNGPSAPIRRLDPTLIA